MELWECRSLDGLLFWDWELGLLLFSRVPEFLRQDTMEWILIFVDRMGWTLMVRKMWYLVYHMHAVNKLENAQARSSVSS